MPVYYKLQLLLRNVAYAYCCIGVYLVIGHRFPDPLHHVTIVGHCVTAFHPLEYHIGTTLERHVEVRRTLGQISYSRQQIVGHVFGIARHELQTIDAVDFMKLMEQVGQSCSFSIRFVTVAVHCLAQERNLAATLIGQDACLGHNLLGRATLFRTADHRHNAVRAEFVAAELNPHVSLPWRRSHRRIT